MVGRHSGLLSDCQPSQRSAISQGNSLVPISIAEWAVFFFYIVFFSLAELEVNCSS